MPSFAKELPEIEPESYNRLFKRTREARWSAKGADKYAGKTTDAIHHGKPSIRREVYCNSAKLRRVSVVKAGGLIEGFKFFAYKWCVEKLDQFTSTEAITPSRTLFLDVVQGLVKKCNGLTLLEKGWDGEDALPIAPQTCKRAQEFLTYHVSKALKKKQNIAFPKISGLPDGSIDLFWKTPEFLFLINFPVEKSSASTFFCEYFEEYRFRGSIVPGGTCELLIDSLVRE